MADAEALTPGEFILTLALAFKGHDAAKSLRREARHVRKGGIRYDALRGMAEGLDKGAEAPIQTVRAIRQVRHQTQALPATDHVWW
jgi:hypothetical protein